MTPGRTLELDFPGLRIGVAEYPDGPTGMTLFLFDRMQMSSADVRGGSVGSIFAEEFGYLRGVCFAGGSTLGLEAIAAVGPAVFRASGKTGPVDFMEMQAIGGAICYDFARPTRVYPDAALAAEAVAAAREGSFPLGRHGAGSNTACGKGSPLFLLEASGQGGAFARVGEARIAAFTVVNAVGAITDRDGQVVRGYRDAATGKRTHLRDQPSTPSTARPGENTTLTLLVTTQKFTPGDLRQVARQVHSSMARAVQPFHTRFDGDVLFAVSFGEVDEPALADPTVFGAVASELAWDAVLTSADV